MMNRNEVDWCCDWENQKKKMRLFCNYWNVQSGQPVRFEKLIESILIIFSFFIETLFFRSFLRHFHVHQQHLFVLIDADFSVCNFSYEKGQWKNGSPPDARRYAWRLRQYNICLTVFARRERNRSCHFDLRRKILVNRYRNRMSYGTEQNDCLAPHWSVVWRANAFSFVDVWLRAAHIIILIASCNEIV